MGFRAWNRKKNLWLRTFKARAAKAFLDHKNPNRFTPAERKNIRKVLFLRHDNKLGDMIVSTLAFRELKKSLPQAEISVIAGPAAAAIIENNPNISRIFLYKKKLSDIWKLGKKLAQEKFDLLIDMDQENSLETILLLRLINPRFAFGFNRQNVQMYNITVPFDFTKFHVTGWHKKAFQTLGLLQENQPFDTSYDLFIPADARTAARDFLHTLPTRRKTIVFNPFAASKHRCFSFKQAIQTAGNFPQANVILVGPGEALNLFGAGENFPPNLFKTPSALCRTYGVWASIALLAEADLLISPDTYIVHAAGALHKPVCAAFTPINKITWGPCGQSVILDVSQGQDFNTVDLSNLARQTAPLLEK